MQHNDAGLLLIILALYLSPQVSFPDCVRWTTIEFDPLCGTAQPEDMLRLFIPCRSLQFSSLSSKAFTHDAINSWTELKKFFGSTGWPTSVLVLPGDEHIDTSDPCVCETCCDAQTPVFLLFAGNEVLFSLETASDYVKDEKACFYGFKCMAVGYEFNPGPDEVSRLLLIIFVTNYVAVFCTD